MNMDTRKLKSLENWTKVGDWDGHYRYVLGAKCAYEIFVEYWLTDTPIGTARASLCVTGWWRNKNTSDTVEREWIGEHLPICELLDIAQKDYDENMN